MSPDPPTATSDPTAGGGLIPIQTQRRFFRPEDPAWVQGVVTFLLLGILVALIFTNRDSGPGWSAVVGLTGMSVAFFFKR
jgi:hypothetical protein